MAKQQLNNRQRQNRKSKQKKEQKKKHIAELHPLHDELWAIIFFLLGLFVFVTNEFPHTTGIVGHWVIDRVARNLSGEAVAFLPIFMAIPALAFLMANKRRKLVLWTIAISFICFSIFLELLLNGKVESVQWPVSVSGGGIIGTYGLFALQTTVGINGTKIFLIGVFSIASILIFNLSLRKLIISLIHMVRNAANASKETKETKEKTLTPAQPAVPLSKKLLYSLFFIRKKGASAAKTSLEPTQLSLQTAPAGIPLPSKEKATPLHYHHEPFIPDWTETVAEPATKPKQEPPVSAPAKSPVQHPVDDDYEFPPVTLLEPAAKLQAFSKGMEEKNKERARILEETLRSFNVETTVVNITPGPSVTRFELQPGVGVKISKITGLSKDIALKLAAADVRIEAPIPGKALVGIEVPNADISTITMRSIIEKTDFFKRDSKLVCGMGLTITGEPVLMDLSKMPHVLIAGATGSGKSVCVNTIILSILLRARPDEVKFLMIDPKKVELSLYENIPHLLAPVVTDPNLAAATLKKWALIEMENRYETFSKVGVKDIKGYNDYIENLEKEYAKKAKKKGEPEEGDNKESDADRPPKKLPYIVVIIDELADLMMVASQEVETTICRLAQMARATGIHLVIATQRPSVNVVTGLIKANVPSRISFFLQSQIDSRTVLDMAGAEKLLGKGDMLYSPVGSFKPKRVQGVFVSEKEVKGVVLHLKQQAAPQYLSELLEVEPLSEGDKKTETPEGLDELFEEAKNIVMSTQYASTSYLQRKLRIGYNRAARIMDELEKEGVISQYAGEKKPRSVAPG